MANRRRYEFPILVHLASECVQLFAVVIIHRCFYGTACVQTSNYSIVSAGFILLFLIEDMETTKFCNLPSSWHHIVKNDVLQCGAPKQLTLVCCPLSYWCFVFKYQLSYSVGREHGWNAQSCSTCCLTFFSTAEKGVTGHWSKGWRKSWPRWRALRARPCRKMLLLKSEAVCLYSGWRRFSLEVLLWVGELAYLLLTHMQSHCVASHILQFSSNGSLSCRL
jgi:hypothetical protein